MKIILKIEFTGDGAWNIDFHVINVCLNLKKIVFSLLSHDNHGILIHINVFEVIF